jgi:hypothetical protein
VNGKYWVFYFNVNYIVIILETNGRGNHGDGGGRGSPGITKNNEQRMRFLHNILHTPRQINWRVKFARASPSPSPLHERINRLDIKFI